SRRAGASAGAMHASTAPAVGREAGVEAALFQPQRVAPGGLGVEEPLPDLFAAVEHARADFGLRQHVAGVAYPGARAAETAVARPVRARRAIRTPVPGRGPGRARCRRADAAAQRAIGVIVVERVGRTAGRRSAAESTAIAQGPQRHPARIAVAGVAGIAVAVGRDAFVH